jgi:hypothetical protein
MRTREDIRAGIVADVREWWGRCEGSGRHTWDEHEAYCPSCCTRWEAVVEYLIERYVGIEWALGPDRRGE